MTEDPRPAGSPTLEDVARAAGVSRATVSRVVNGVRNVDPVIQESVRQAVAATGYTPNRAARSLVTRRTDAIALVVSGAGDDPTPEDETGGAHPAGSTGGDGGGHHAGSTRGAHDPDEPDGGAGSSFTAQVFADPFFGRVVTGVVNYLRPRGMYPVLMFAETSRARDEVVSYLRQGSADGALVVSTHADDPLPALITDAGLPAVLYARPSRPTRISYVDLAHQDGARLAAEHLLARGCRRIATITGPLDVPAGQDRLAGFRDTMARAGQPYLPLAEGRFTQESGEAAMARLLAEHPDLDGVFAANDVMAVGACHVLREHGRRVPEDVAVIGFDDSSAAVACRPPLTTVRQPVEEMAAEMARLLLDRLAGSDRAVTSVIFEPSLVVRGSA
ncbi:LacI family transcriptional regulator [Streptomyces scopuliridis]|uniref:LacI family transcriptional regulator n=1 Tax=Streptomyces scopuliridis TaxID=452529 RepID=A0ACD4ZWE1_9ACTN|nr:LacI family DNA-binding transcriptional regulator [Streptomyces scopuliridis]WSB37688.1 LacI family transcriptional regulator [Streptomyces scopuliridis]WSC02142.1 LacI family transcriptional regulator [Streptomyces scopuliridis]WSC04321.1 LacI family transcriptional regulator [Streptomyces scopuliridis]